MDISNGFADAEAGSLIQLYLQSLKTYRKH